LMLAGTFTGCGEGGIELRAQAASIVTANMRPLSADRRVDTGPPVAAVVRFGFRPRNRRADAQPRGRHASNGHRQPTRVPYRPASPRLTTLGTEHTPLVHRPATGRRKPGSIPARSRYGVRRRRHNRFFREWRR